MIQIDINARTVRPEQRVWRLFPGSGYRFLDFFISDGVGYLDLPALALPSGDLAEVDLIPLIAASAAFKERLPAEQDASKISVDPKDYEDARRTAARGRIQNAVVNFYQEAKSGDLLVLPEPLYTRSVWIGEFKDNKVIGTGYHKRHTDVLVPARNIHWLQQVKENTLSSALSEVLRSQHPFTLLEKSLFVEVLSLVYGSFIYGDTHVSTIYNGYDYLDSDAAILGVISRLSSAACLAIDNNQEGLGGSDILSILLSSPPIDYSCQQESDIHSPGFTRYISGRNVAIVTAAVVAAFIGLSQLSSAEEIRANIDNVEIINTADGADPMCNAYVREASKRILQNVDIDKTIKMCQDLRDAGRRAGLRSSAVPTVQPQR